MVILEFVIAVLGIFASAKTPVLLSYVAPVDVVALKCTLVSAALGPVYENTPVPLLYVSAPSPLG